MNYKVWSYLFILIETLNENKELTYNTHTINKIAVSKHIVVAEDIGPRYIVPYGRKEQKYQVSDLHPSYDA